MTTERKNTVMWSRRGNRLRELSNLMDLLQSATPAGETDMSVFSVMWLIPTQCRPWPASWCSCCSSGTKPDSDPVPGGRAPTAKGNAHSLGNRRYSWQRWTRTKRGFFFLANKTKQNSVNTKSLLKLHRHIQYMMYYVGTVAGIIMYYQLPLPHHLILIIHVKARCDNKMHFNHPITKQWNVGKLQNT